MRAARWSETEVQELRKFATKVTVAELTRKIGRSRGAVTAKAFELKSDAPAGQRRLQPRSSCAERASRD
jgi:hypothetical protein